MSEMVDRVSAALAQSFKDAVAAGAEMPFEQTGVTLPAKAVWDRYAQVAIKALREPTEAMLHAKHPDHGENGVDWFLDFWDAADVWHAMMDEAEK